MIKAFTNWLDHRTGYKLLVHEALNEPIPGGTRWAYVPGSTLTFVFMVQVITGVFLWSAYSPSTLTAWESVYYIQNVMEYGWLVRGIHAFAAQAMVVLMAVHFWQVIWYKAYTAPREVNFWLGLVLMQIVLGLALTGYLLPWDQKGYYATQVATKIVGATPFIGQEAQELLQGGKAYGHHTLTRFFALHAGVLPALLVVFLGLHIYVFRRHGITTPKPDAPPATFWPGQVMKDAVACLIVLAIVMYFVITKGAELSAPADPAEDFPARPEWYFLFLFRFLKYEWVEQYGLAFGAIYVPGIAMGIIALMPILGKARAGHWFNILFTAALTVGAGYLTGIAMDEDNKDVEFQAKLKFAHRDGLRVVELAEREGIPPLGARELMANDSYTQGPRLFARHCSGCHRFDEHDGVYLPKLRYIMDEHGHNVIENGQKKYELEQPTAADLGKFGSREWMQAVLVDYHNTFKPIADSVQTPDEDMKESQKQAIEALNAKKKRFLEEQMAGWSTDNKDKLLDAANAESYKALVEFLVAQSGRADLKVDENLVKQGREVFTTGALANGSVSACTDCHTMKVRGETEFVTENSGSGVPTLTGYAGKEWLTAFLKDPGHADFYGDNNIMPAFAEAMTEKELGLLVDWMVGDYYRSEHHTSH